MKLRTTTTVAGSLRSAVATGRDEASRRASAVRHAALARDAAPRGILRRAGVPPRRTHLSVKWREKLVGDDGGDDAEEEARRVAQLERERQLRARWLTVYRSLRLPQLAYEFFVIPVRVAFPLLPLPSPVFIALDVFVDVFEIAAICVRLYDQHRAPRTSPAAVSAAVSTTHHGGGARGGSSGEASLTRARLALDVLTIVLLHAGRARFLLLGGALDLWLGAQLARCVRAHDLFEYMRRINSDLGTNVRFLAAFKFALVLLSVPHWIACAWWLLAEVGEGGAGALPAWPAQLELLAANPKFAPAAESESEQYLLSLYMAWTGVTAMGYGTITFVRLADLLFAVLICVVQIVFYAFVLGTLFHYLVRTDGSTLQFKELLKAVDEYGHKRSLPPAVVRKMRNHFVFQHRKAASGTAKIFEQLPLSLKVKVAKAQHHKHVHATWVLHHCSAQLLDQIVIVLKERYAMPLEVLFNQGDGARELLWCVGGSLAVRSGDAHIATLRSDLGAAGPVVGELSFFLGIHQPYTVAATASGDVTLLVLAGSDYDDVIGSYPEQAELIMGNILNRFGLEPSGADAADGGGGAAAAALDDAEREEHEAVRELIRAAIIARNEESLAQMAAAASEGDVETVRALARRGTDLSVGNYDGRTTLHLAAAEGNDKVAALLCQLGAEVDARDQWGATPLAEALRSRHHAVALELRAHGAVAELERPAAALCAAAAEGNVEHVGALLEHGVDISAANHDGRTALHLSAAEGNLRVVEYLISRLADANAKDRWGRTPVDAAMLSGRTLVTQLLVRAGAVPNRAALAERLFAAAAGGDVAQLQFVVESGASVDAVGYDGRTPLHVAAASGSITAVAYLLDAMADVSATDRWGATPLVDALRRNNEVAALIAQTSAARLPERFAEDAELQALLAGALAQDMYAVNRNLWRRKRRRANWERAVVSHQHELGVALTELDGALGQLVQAQTVLAKRLPRCIEDWVSSYAREREEDDSADEEDDVRSESGSESGSSDDGGGAAASAPARATPVHPIAANARAGGGEVASGHAFTRLVLRLPRAEAGLELLRSHFESRLSPSAYAGLGPLARAHAERQAALALLRELCMLSQAEAVSVLAEVSEQLALLCGPGVRVAGLAEGGAASRGAGAGGAAHLAGSPSAGSAADAPDGGSLWREAAAAAAAGPEPALARPLFAGATPASAAGSSALAWAEPDAELPWLFLSHAGFVCLFLSESLVRALTRPPIVPPDAPRVGRDDSAMSDTSLSGRFRSRRSRGGALFSSGEVSPAASQWARCSASRAAGVRSPCGSRIVEPDSAEGAPAPPDWAPSSLPSPTVVSLLQRLTPTAGRRSAGVTGGGAGPPLPSHQTSTDGGSVDLGSSESRRRTRRSTPTGERRDDRSTPTGAQPAGPGATSPTAVDESRSARLARWAGASKARSHAESAQRCSGSVAQATRVVSGVEGGVGAAPIAGTPIGVAETEELLATPLRAVGVACGGRASRASDRSVGASAPPGPPAELVDAASFLRDLFACFDRRGERVIRIRDVRSLQGRLGEMGGDDIKSLLRHLLELASLAGARASAGGARARGGRARAGSVSARANPSDGGSFGTPGSRLRHADEGGLGGTPGARRRHPSLGGGIGGGNASLRRRSSGLSQLASALGQDGEQEDGAARAPRLRRLTAPQFMAGAASWVLASRAEEEAEEARGGAAPAAPAGTDAAAAGALVINLSSLHKPAGEQGGADGGGGGAGMRRASLSTMLVGASAGATPAPGKAGEPSAGAGGGAATAGSAEESAAAKALGEALGSASALGALADALQRRIDSGQLTATAEANAVGLAEAGADGGAGGPVAAQPAHVPSVEWRRAWLAWSAEQLDAHVLPERKLAGGGGAPTRTPAATPGAKASSAQPPPPQPAAASWSEYVGAVRTRAAAVRSAEGARARAAGGGGGGGGSSEGGAELGAAGDARACLLLRHDGLASFCVERLFLGLSAWEVVLMPLQLAFFDEASALGWWLGPHNHALSAFYLLRIALRFRTTYVNESSVTVWDPAQITRNYMATELGWDMVAAWPQDLFALALDAQPVVVLGLRLTRLINARYVWRAYKAWTRNKADDNLLRGLVHYLTILALAAHVCTCVFAVFGYSRLAAALAPAWPEQYAADAAAVGGTVPAHPGTDPADAPPFSEPGPRLVRKYAICSYFVWSTVTTLGLGQVPANFGEVLCFLLFLLLNITIYAWVVGQISALVMKQDDEIVQKRAQLELVHSYLSHVRVPAPLKDAIGAFFHARLRDASLSAVRDDAIYDSLPIVLQVEVSRSTNRGLVASTALLRGCSDGFIDRLSSLMRERAVEPELILFRAAEPCKELFVIEAGAVDVLDEGEGGGELSHTALPGETVGELPFVFGMRHIETARTTSDAETRLFVLSAEKYRLLLKAFPNQEDVIMDNAMAEHSGALTARSGRSRFSARSGSALGSSAGPASESGRSALSDGTRATGAVEESASINAIQRIVANAKKRRSGLHTVQMCGACAAGDVGKVRRLLGARSVEVNRGDYDERRPLHVAASHGRLAVVRLLLSVGADVNVRDRHGRTPLHDAQRRCHDETARALLEAGAELDSAELIDELCAAAADSSAASRLQYLLRFRADASLVNLDERTALHVAAAAGHAQHVQLLLEHAADANAADRVGRTPLSDAFHVGHDHVSEVLLASGAHMGSFDGAHAMCLAAAKDDVRTLQRLVAHGVRVNAADAGGGRTALHLAASNSSVSACHFLLAQRSLALDAEDRMGHTPLDDALREVGAEIEVVRSMLQAKGATRGTGQPRHASSIDHLEEARAEQQAAQLARTRQLLDGVRTVRAWVGGAAGEARAARELVEEASRAERARGAVLSEEQPELWPRLKQYAAGRPERYRQMTTDVQPALTEWRAELGDFATTLTAGLSKKVVRVAQFEAALAQPLESLLEADFGTAPADGEDSNAANHARTSRIDEIDPATGS